MINEKTPEAVAAAVGGEDQNPSRGTIMTNDTRTTRWPVTREAGFDEVHIADDEHGVSAYVTHIDGEDFWRVELALQNAQAFRSCKEDQVAAARLMAEAARCVLELNGEQAAA